MSWAIGQCVISRPEPELGLGKITSIQGKRIEVRFVSESRVYSTIETPVERKLFRQGNVVLLQSGCTLEIETVNTEDRIVSYRCTNGKMISEAEIVGMMGGESSLDILSNHVSSPEEFQIRKIALEIRGSSESSPVRGFIGGKIDLMKHQFAVASTIVNARNRRFFLADEVGLGKTIESALVIHRLLVTGEISRVLIVTPAALQYQWFVELYRKFSITVRVADSELAESFATDTVADLDAIPLLLVSVDQMGIQSPFRDAILASEWDMMVIDEAHHLDRDHVAFSKISELAGRCPDLLLLSATPDVLTDESFFTLMQLIDAEKFNCFEKFQEEQTLYQFVSKLADVIIDGGDVSVEQFEFLKSRFPSMGEWCTPSRMNHTERISATALLSDICGIGRSLFRHSRSVVAPSGDRQVELFALEKGSIGEWLDQFLKDHRSEKIVIICSDTESMCQLEQSLSKNTNRKIAMFHEEMSIIQLDRSVAWFADPDGAECLLATQIGCEGRNFQFAHHLVLIDLPVDPELLEQRIGRVDRIGRTSPVSIKVPYEIGTTQEHLARWYHQGMNAFSSTVPGGYRAAQKFIERALEIVPGTESWNQLCEETILFCSNLAKAVEAGRHRLLELSSDDSGKAAELIEHVKECEEIGFDQPVETILTHFGVEIDELSSEILHLTFENITDHTFPVPLGAEEDGVTATFNRELALAREDAIFLTADHPMVIGAVDLILSGSAGKVTAIRLPGQGEEGLLCEQVWRIVPKKSRGVVPEKYFSSKIETILFDEFGDRVEELFGETLEWGKTVAHSDPDELVDEWHETVTDLIRAGETIVEENREILIKNALSRIETDYSKELARVGLLQGENTMLCRHIEEERTKLIESIEKSDIVLEAIRLVLVEM